MSDSSKRGLGSRKISSRKKHQIQSAGGTASPQNFANNPDLASEAGSKGGRASRRKNRDTGSSRGGEE